ncbi:DUF3558 domain-containing protein [Streptomyces sp. NPDC007088]|uniref:DUF3558 domain-containing protein n=1 Tax=Streptomyces sp. NPDC007088 TaxID=3364773 RepID=UPI00369DE8EE
MRRKVYVPGAAALLAAVLCGCTGGSADGDGTADGKPGTQGTTAAAAQPGKYGTLPEPCGVLDHGTLDALLPGLKELDEDERDAAYRGTMALTYDNERRVGCRWKAEDADSSDALRIGFERVVSYDADVSDDDRATSVYEKLEDAAKLPAAPGTAPVVTPSPTGDGKNTDTGTDPGASKGTDTDTDTDTRPGKDTGGNGAAQGTGPDGARGGEKSPGTPTGSGTNGNTSPSSTVNPDNGDAGDNTGDPGARSPELRPRLLTGLGNSAFLDDQLAKAGAATGRRTVTVVFRTSNVVVSVEYEQQPARAGELADSKEMQDKAQKVARSVADSFDE